MVWRNLLEGAGLGEVYLALRRGSGPPLAELSGDPPPAAAAAAGGWGSTRAEARAADGTVSAVALYYRVADERVANSLPASLLPRVPSCQVCV